MIELLNVRRYASNPRAAIFVDFCFHNLMWAKEDANFDVAQTSAFFSINKYDETAASILALEYAQRVAFFFRHYDCRTPRPTEAELCALGGDLYEETKEFEALMLSTRIKPAVRSRGQSIRSIFSSASSSASASAASSAGG